MTAVSTHQWESNWSARAPGSQPTALRDRPQPQESNSYVQAQPL